MRRKKQKKQKVLNYKKAYRHAKAVIKASEKGYIPRSPSAEKFVKEIEPHMTKKGTLKKRDIRSNVQISNINKIIFKYTDKNNINKSVKKIHEEFLYNAQNLANKKVSSDISEKTGIKKGKAIIKNFVNFSLENLQNIFYLSSEQIIDLSNNYNEISTDDIEYIIETLVQNKLNNTPIELQNKIKDDDFYKLTDKILNLIKNKKYDKNDINYVFNNFENDIDYSDKQKEILEYLSGNNIFNIGR